MSTRRILVGFLFDGPGPEKPGHVLLARVVRNGRTLAAGYTVDYPVGSHKAVVSVLAESLHRDTGILLVGSAWELVADVWGDGYRVDVFRGFAGGLPAATPPGYLWQPPGLWIDPTRPGPMERTADLPVMLALALARGYGPVVLHKEPADAKRGRRGKDQHAGEQPATQYPGGSAQDGYGDSR